MLINQPLLDLYIVCTMIDSLAVNVVRRGSVVLCDD